MTTSVIIPTRNRFEYIKLLIDDLQKQTVSKFEIIVMDQSDEQKTLDNCIHVFTDSIGPCISRNLGIKKATGDILVFLDDDARVGNDFIYEITKPILNEKFDAVAGAICDLRGNYTLENGQFFTRGSINFIKVLTANPNSSKSRISISFPGGCSAISAKVLQHIGYFEESYDPTGAGEDREMALRLYKHGYSIWYNANAKLLHVQAPVGGSRDVGSRTLMLDVHTYKMCKKHFSDELAATLKSNILNGYRQKFIESIFRMTLTRSKYFLWQEAKLLMK